MSGVKAEGGDGDQLNLSVRAQDGSEVHFRVRRTTRLKKVFEAYCQRQGVEPTATRFTFDGQRLDPNHTAQEAGLEDNDSIEAWAEQTGGL